MTRTKRLASEPLLSLSSTKQTKRRKIVKNVNCVANDDNSHEVERALHVCSPRCSALNSSCPVTEPRDGEQSEEDDILYTSDQNENDLQDYISRDRIT